MAPLLAPQSSPLQKAASSKPRPPVPNVCVVTGGTGFVGQRLVEMLVERGAKKVISLDIVPPPKDAWQHPAIDWRVCDDRTTEALPAHLLTAFKEQRAQVIKNSWAKAHPAKSPTKPKPKPRSKKRDWAAFVQQQQQTQLQSVHAEATAALAAAENSTE